MRRLSDRALRGVETVRDMLGRGAAEALKKVPMSDGFEAALAH